MFFCSSLWSLSLETVTGPINLLLCAFCCCLGHIHPPSFWDSWARWRLLSLSNVNSEWTLGFLRCFWWHHPNAGGRSGVTMDGLWMEHHVLRSRVCLEKCCKCSCCCLLFCVHEIYFQVHILNMKLAYLFFFKGVGSFWFQSRVLGEDQETWNQSELNVKLSLDCIYFIEFVFRKACLHFTLLTLAMPSVIFCISKTPNDFYCHVPSFVSFWPVASRRPTRDFQTGYSCFILRSEGLFSLISSVIWQVGEEDLR